jgi:hypothetical protein
MAVESRGCGQWPGLPRGRTSQAVLVLEGGPARFGRTGTQAASVALRSCFLKAAPEDFLRFRRTVEDLVDTAPHAPGAVDKLQRPAVRGHLAGSEMSSVLVESVEVSDRDRPVAFDDDHTQMRGVRDTEGEVVAPARYLLDTERPRTPSESALGVSVSYQQSSVQSRPASSAAPPSTLGP